MLLAVEGLVPGPDGRKSRVLWSTNDAASLEKADEQDDENAVCGGSYWADNPCIVRFKAANARNLWPSVRHRHECLRGPIHMHGPE